MWSSCALSRFRKAESGKSAEIDGESSYDEEDGDHHYDFDNHRQTATHSFVHRIQDFDFHNSSGKSSGACSANFMARIRIVAIDDAFVA